jgi:5-methylcytosine-specific restriction protein A
MPNKPLRACSKSGCPNLAADGRCEKHKQVWARDNEPDRIRGRTLQGERERLLNAHPLCIECLRHGIDREATQRDHIVPLAEGGQDVEENTQALCRECHDRKSKRETVRGVKRRWGGG